MKLCANNKFFLFGISILASGSLLLPLTANASILFQNDDYSTIPSTSVVLNSDNETSGDIYIKFGANLNKNIKWDSGNTRFAIDSNLDLANYQISSTRIENVSALPGGALGLGSGGTGRVVQLTATDSTAPGCTIPPNCPTGSYTWSGFTWMQLDGPPGGAGHTQNTDVGTTSNTFTMDLDNTGGDVALQFGNALAKQLKWDSVANYFYLNDKLRVGGDLDVNGTNLVLDADNTGAGSTVTITANQGTSPTGVIRFNTTKGTWEISDYANRYKNIGYGDNTESRNRIIAGLKIIQDNLPSAADNTIQNEIGTYQINGVQYVKADNQTLTIGAASAQPRWDSVEIGTSGTITVTQGTPAASPQFTDLPANRIRLAFVYVPASPASPQVFNANITDFATINGAIPGGTNLNYTINLATGTSAGVRIGDRIRVRDSTGAQGTATITAIPSGTQITVNSITGPIATGATCTVLLRNSFIMDSRGDTPVGSESSAGAQSGSNRFVGYGGTWIDLNGLKWDSLDRPVATWSTANDTCLGSGGLMATIGQLYTHRTGAIEVPNITASPLWVDGMVSTNSALTLVLSTATISSSNIGSTKNYRCVSPF